ncbi:LysR family transcriptional regulator [Aquabacterium sp. A08]|uniref:LysR family transcriptional regulator n=1 Tax=Aquabacterium sp. A08 TaxID=2718532 RepID=UPI00141E9901|nr:LysR family transcriptional regulator [Aquabacterium sp. A08]NIC41554.1 LysR family transcriptional regulator [Aquabacterium sp. A08]NIC42078.1 LysR family transcriptional regulator [Aquabacterium sp. A08]NIC42127.1 LysR family transcriptional regulator [Aquabacterium sp. A08]
MQKQRAALSPENLTLIGTVARAGSMAAAARELGLVPSALTYRVRQVEEALDVLLFDRHARRAQLTPAGAELLRVSEHLLLELDAVAQRVKRIATGWEPQLTITADAIVSRTTLFELCEAFYELGAPTRLRLRAETLSGTLETLLTGQADLALGVTLDSVNAQGLHSAPLGEVQFVFVVAPHHPLAQATEALTPADLQPHRVVAVADSTQRGSGLTFGLLPGQDVLTVPTMQHKLEAQLRGLGCGSLPLPLVQPFVDAGRLVVKATTLPARLYRPSYAWRGHAAPGGRRGSGQAGRALAWWTAQLARPATRHALLHNHHAR